MPNFSQITIIGHLGRDPETRNAGESTVTSFSVAVKTGYGERVATTWYRVSVWGKAGDRAQKNLHKGDAVTVTGEFSLSEYTDKEGLKRVNAEIRADRWGFAGSKAKEPTAAEKEASEEFFGGRPVVSAATEADGFDDEIPF